MSLVNAFKRLVSGKKPLASDVNQLIDALSGNADIGPLSLFAPIANPSAPTVAVNTTAGVLNGNYQYIQVNVTGWIGSDGQFYVQGFAPSAASAVVAPANQQVNVTLTVGPAGTIARALYRPVAGGTAYKFVQWFDDNTTTAWTDNVADANLGTGMPTVNGSAIPAAVPASNTTGTTLTATAANQLNDYNGSHVIKATWNGGTLAFEVDSTPNVALLGQGGSQIFTASGTFTVPAGVSRVFVQVWGGGGSGAVGESGGGGGYAEGWVEVSEGQQITVTVSPTAPGSTGSSGTAGGTSSFGSWVSASGGGSQAISTNSGGGMQSGTYGVSGGNGVASSKGGNGATSFGGVGGAQSTSGPGGNGAIPGGGGGNGTTSGGSGARGEARVYW